MILKLEQQQHRRTSSNYMRTNNVTRVNADKGKKTKPLVTTWLYQLHGTLWYNTTEDKAK